MTTFEDSLIHYNHLKGLINTWLKTTMNQSNLVDYDIVCCGSREDQFEFTKWNYNFEKPSLDVIKGKIKVESKSIIKPPLPIRKMQTINNLAGLS